MSLGSPRPTVEAFFYNLKSILGDGARAAKLMHHAEFIAMIESRLSDQSHPDRDLAALKLERLIREAVSSLGDGPQGRAARLLFGLDQDTRGRTLRDRRRIAAGQFDVLPSTFRRNYEDDLVWDVAVELFRILEVPAA